MLIKIGFVSRKEIKSIKLVERLIESIGSRAEILVEPDIAQQLDRKSTTVEEMEEQRADLIVSVGGDGTILRAIHKMKDPIPIIGINMGTLGFLVDVEPEDAIKTMENLLLGFQVDERSRLKISINGKEMPPATNEIVLTTASPAKMIDFDILVDGSLLEKLRADGVIFATSTGSTAYAMSAGGPIVDPRVDVIVLVPIAPFKLSARPWVIPADNKIQAMLTLPEKEALVVIDGQTMATISCNDSIMVSRATTPARFVKARREGFYERVKSKLS